jgi:putative ABC transport system permease protein
VGTHTFDALDARFGDRVTAQSSGAKFDYRIVGRVVVPSLAEPQAVADGAVFTGAGLDRLDIQGDVSGSSAFVVRFRAGVDRAQAARRIARLPGIGEFGLPKVASAEIPLDVERLRQIDRIPPALGVFLTVLGAVAVGHLLVTSVQRRRRDFAVLKSLGFSRSQIYATVCTQATTVACVGLVVGLLAGIAVGGALWRAAAESVGILPEVDVPVLELMGVALVSIVLANAVAAFPARTAARTSSAAMLRSE